MFRKLIDDYRNQAAQRQDKPDGSIEFIVGSNLP
jgi:hypothetical protein